jgi:cold shock CspA family protein
MKEMHFSTKVILTESDKPALYHISTIEKDGRKYRVSLSPRGIGFTSEENNTIYADMEDISQKAMCILDEMKTRPQLVRPKGLGFT